MGRDELERDVLRRRVEHVEGLDLRVPAPGAKALEHELRVGLVVRRADLVRLGGHPFEPAAHFAGIKLLVEARLERRLGARVARLEADHLWRGLGRDDRRGGKERREEQGGGPRQSDAHGGYSKRSGRSG